MASLPVASVVKCGNALFYCFRVGYWRPLKASGISTGSFSDSDLNEIGASELIFNGKGRGDTIEDTEALKELYQEAMAVVKAVKEVATEVVAERRPIFNTGVAFDIAISAAGIMERVRRLQDFLVRTGETRAFAEEHAEEAMATLLEGGSQREKRTRFENYWQKAFRGQQAIPVEAKKDAAFVVGRTYTCRSIGDSNLIFKFKLIARKGDMLTLEEKGGDPHRRKVSIYKGEENCYPLGKYSMCPILKSSEYEGSKPEAAPVNPDVALLVEFHDGKRMQGASKPLNYLQLGRLKKEIAAGAGTMLDSYVEQSDADYLRISLDGKPVAFWTYDAGWQSDMIADPYGEQSRESTKPAKASYAKVVGERGYLLATRTLSIGALWDAVKDKSPADMARIIKRYTEEMGFSKEEATRIGDSIARAVPVEGSDVKRYNIFSPLIHAEERLLDDVTGGIRYLTVHALKYTAFVGKEREKKIGIYVDDRGIQELKKELIAGGGPILSLIPSGADHIDIYRTGDSADSIGVYEHGKWRLGP